MVNMETLIWSVINEQSLSLGRNLLFGAEKPSDSTKF